jgi:hypothetical protein
MAGVSKTLTAWIACLVVLTVPVVGQSQKRKPPAPRKATPQSVPAPRQEKPVPFKPGEVLTYDVSYSGAVSAGEVTLSVREKRPSYSSLAYYIVAEGMPTGLLAKAYTLYYKIDTLVDTYTLLPQRGSIYSIEGRRTRQKTTLFDQSARTASYEVRTATVVTQAVNLPASTHDALSTLVALRSTPLQAGQRLSVPVCDEGHRYMVQFAVEGLESVATAALTAPAWRIRTTVFDDQGQPQGLGLFIWISNDTRRLPLRMKAELPVGSFILDLRQMQG